MNDEITKILFYISLYTSMLSEAEDVIRDKFYSACLAICLTGVNFISLFSTFAKLNSRY